MNFQLTDFQIELEGMTRELAQREIDPYVAEWDETQKFPRELFYTLGKAGLMGILVPASWGGSGLGYVEYVLVISELAKHCGAIALSVAAHNSLCTGHILQFGTEIQKRTYLPKLASGEWIGAWGLTEANTGSDAGNMKTVAQKQNNQWVLNGTKSWITHGKSADVAVVIARSGNPGDRHGMSAFIVERGAHGFLSGKKENKLGMRASETAEMVFDQCVVPHEHLLGQEGEGFLQALKILDGGRISIAALSFGIAQGAFEAALEYAKIRHQFNQPIASFQGISFKLADMETWIDASRWVTFQAATMKDAGLKITREAAMAKYYASETAVRVAEEAVQIFGANGYSKEYPVEKYYRDAKLCTIGEGTSEIQKIVIARDVLQATSH